LHGCHDDAGLIPEELSQLGDGSLNDVNRCGQPARPDPDPEPCGIEPETGDLRGDTCRLMSVEGEDTHAELEPWGCGGEVPERLQARCARLVVRPQRVVPEVLASGGEVTSESRVEACGDAKPSPSWCDGAA
jgi:hypothetical protein